MEKKENIGMNDQNQSPIPDKFACIIDGYFRPSYAVEIDGTGCLIYKAMGKEYKIRKSKKGSFRRISSLSVILDMTQR